jgi:NADPH:quinone reductase-like Zn-dependent oxidoreductase
MKAAQFNTYGDTSVIEINENAENVQAKAGQILVEVVSAGLNPVESAIRKGYMQQMLPLSLPANIGGDFSGVVAAVGSGVTQFKVGDEVYGIANQFKGGSGSVAAYVTANTANTALKPASIGHTEAAGLPLVGTSAIQALTEHIHLRSGQKLLIHGGAGGIGSIAVMLAKSLGAYVVATAGTDSIEFVKSLGADEVIDYKTQDLASLVHDFDAVFDTVGGEVTGKSISVLKSGGILVSMAGQVDPESAKAKGITALTQMTKGDTSQLDALRELVEAGKIKPLVGQVFPFDQAKAAYDLLENGSIQGKVVIEIK